MKTTLKKTMMMACALVISATTCSAQKTENVFNNQIDITEVVDLYRTPTAGKKIKFSRKDKRTTTDNSKWMKDLSNERLVADLSLPGSHDACTNEGWRRAKFLGNVTAKAQDLTIKEQLEAGVRAFDMRPERVRHGKQYELRCSHGIMQTNMLVSEFFSRLENFLDENPSEFCIVTVHLTNTKQKSINDWRQMFCDLIYQEPLKSRLAEFTPQLTVGQMRGKILLISRRSWEDNPQKGAFTEGWTNDKHFENQTNGTIWGTDGKVAPLWTQDYYKPGKDRQGEDVGILKMLEAATTREMNCEAPAWVFNYTAAYVSTPASNHYRKNASCTNMLAANYLAEHNGSTGIVYMDFAGVDVSKKYMSRKAYQTNGMVLVNALINQNFK